MIALIGGAGYIGSHISRLLIDDQQPHVILDNLSNSNYFDNFSQYQFFKNTDIRDFISLSSALREFSVEKIIHLAALKDARKSNIQKQEYSEVNVQGTLNVLRAMQINEIKRVIFSSTAAVYGTTNDNFNAFKENDATVPSNWYGETKLIAEKAIEQATKNGDISAVVFRYFNVGGASFRVDTASLSGSILFNLKQALKSNSEFEVYGDNFKTPDGSAVRDYVHVEDIAKAHLSALGSFDDGSGVFRLFNLGSNHGNSVFEVISKFELAAQRAIKLKIVSRKEGDPDFAVADAGKAKIELRWQSIRNLEEICSDFIANSHLE